MLTKKDFKAVAEIIKKAQGDGWPGYDRGYIDGVMRTAIDLADYFATQNPRFDRKRFMKACGLGD